LPQNTQSTRFYSNFFRPMESMRKILLSKLIQIFSLGVSEEHSDEVKQKIKLTNAFAFFHFIAGCGISYLFYKISGRISVLVSASIGAWSMLIVLLLNYFKKTLIAKLYLIIALAAIFAFFRSLLGILSDIHFFLILLIGLSVMIFTNRERKYLYFTLPIPFLTAIFLESPIAHQLIEPIILPAQSLQYIRWVVIFFVFSLFTAMVLLFSGYIQKAKEEAQLLAFETLEQNELLEAQEEELRQNLEELQATQDALDDKNTLLKRKNTLIMSSITYAQNIQQAILPSQDDMSRVFQEWFAIYKPKDVVSGDFYWMSYIEKKTFIAVVDCTGHGVPGAFMSMIGSTLLNEIINEKHIFAVDQILDILHYKVRTSLKQQFGHNQDGMDICLCCLESQDNQFKVEFAGAKRPLLYTHQQQLHKLQGDKQSIAGWSRDDRHFERQTLTLQKGDCLYLSSDGFVDTPSPRRKTFGNRRFEKMITQYTSYSMVQQKQFFIQTLEDYQQTTEQRDDITLVGIRV